MVLALMFSTHLHASFFERNAEGWHWYQDPMIEEEKEIKPEDTDHKSSLTATEIVKSYAQELEKRLHTAWVNPTYKNLRDYQEMQKDLMGRSETFSNIWMQVLYQNPYLDYTIGFPVNQKGRHVYLDNQKQMVQETIQSLKESFGLFFFFKSGCAYCEAFAPIVQQFSQNTGWEVLAISIDGSQLPGFKQVVVDNGLFAKLQIGVLPALFAVNPKTQAMLPIAYGLTSIEEMESRIMTLVSARGNKS